MNWIVRKMSSSISKPAYRVVTQGGESVCYISMSTPNAKQKAELITAVPQLLEALEDAASAIMSIDLHLFGRDVHTGHYYRDELMSKIDTAIAAAKGET